MMNEPEFVVNFNSCSDKERLEMIRAAWLADLPLKVAFILIGRAAFDEIQKSGE